MTLLAFEWVTNFKHNGILSEDLEQRHKSLSSESEQTFAHHRHLDFTDWYAQATYFLTGGESRRYKKGAFDSV